MLQFTGGNYAGQRCDGDQCVDKYSSCHIDKNKGVAKSAQGCYSAIVMDMTYMIVDFYWDILYLVMCVLGLVILALLLILWDLIGLLFTPLVQALGLGAYIKQVIHPHPIQA